MVLCIELPSESIVCVTDERAANAVFKSCTQNIEKGALHVVAVAGRTALEGLQLTLLLLFASFFV